MKSADARVRAHLNDDVYAFEETNFDQTHLWVVNLTGTATQITFGAYSVTSYAVGANGRIAMTRAPSPLLEHLRGTEVWVMDATGGNAQRITAERPAEVHLLTGTGPMRRVTRVFEVVLRPNYRGSTGYGDAFLRDMVGGYFKQAHLDLLAGAVLFRIQVELEWFDRWLSGREYRWETVPTESAPDKTATRP